MNEQNLSMGMRYAYTPPGPFRLYQKKKMHIRLQHHCVHTYILTNQAQRTHRRQNHLGVLEKHARDGILSSSSFSNRRMPL